MKSDLISQGSLCLEASATEPAEAQASTIWRLDLCRKATYSCFTYKAHFLPCLGCDLVSWICFVNEQGFALSMSRARSFINLKKVFWNRNISVLTRVLPVMDLFWGGFVFSPERKSSLENYEWPSD